MRRVQIIWAIAAKDILEAVKNKNALMALIGTFFIVVLYRLMPVMNVSEKPYIPVYDAGDSKLVAMLDNSGEINLRDRATKAKMEEYLSRANVPELGLLIPADFDQAVANGDPLILQGYVMSWVNDSQAAELQQFTETFIAELLGAPVEIQIAGNIVYMQPDSRGWMMAPLAIVFAVILMGCSLVPQLVLEEKKTKTMDALLLSPAGPFEIAMGKAVVGLFYGVLTTGVALAIYSHLVRQWWLAIAAVLCGTMFTIALGLLLGTVIETQQQLRLFSLFVIMPLFLPAAFMLLGDLLPDWLIAIFRWVPLVAVLRLLRISFSNQSGWALYGPPFAVLLGSIIVAMALVVWRMRRLEK